MVKLGGSPDARSRFPDYMQANAAVDDAERNLDNTKIVAPIDGVATQVPADRTRPRRAARASRCSRSSPTQGLWVDANPKESDMTYVRVRASPRRSASTRSPAGNGRARSARSRPAPARSSRSCRRRTRAATGSRSSSACRCASASTRGGHGGPARRHERLRLDRHRPHPLARGHAGRPEDCGRRLLTARSAGAAASR